MIMPCGTGKSLTAFWIARKVNAKSILIAVPSLALLQQTLKVWTREYLIAGIRPDWLCVCSDQTVSDDQDDFVSNIYDLGIDVTTDKADIKKFLQKKNSNLKIVFTTYQSGKVTAQGAKGFKFDLGIMDEAHKTVGHGEKAMAHLIHQKNIKIKNRLFMTATERLFRGDKDEYLSMDDPRDYGEIIYQLSFKAAIEMKPPIISDYKIITFGITAPEIEAVYSSNKFIQVKKEIDNITAREFATAIALRKAIKKLKISNAISFHSSIKRANNFKKQQELISKVYKQYGKIKTFHVSGAMATSQRASQMREFAEGKGLMTNARCLTEGVDLPAIDCVVFTDPKRSKVDIVQAAGRALRLSKGKKFGYILIPILISEDENATEAAKDTAFEDIVATIRALATQDTRIVDYLRAVSSGTIPRGGSPIKELIKLNVLTKVNEEEFNKSIQLKVWDRVAFGNWRSYEEAKKFIHKLKFANNRDYYNGFIKNIIPRDFPRHPNRVYKTNGWISWGDFLGTGYEHIKIYKTYNQAKEIIKKYNLKSQNDHKIFASKNKKFFNQNKIPTFPGGYYGKRKSWISWGDYLGTGKVADQYKNFYSYEKAKKFIKPFNLKNTKDWIKFSQSKKRPEYIPASPRDTYLNNGWKGFGDFLGFGISEKYVKLYSYNEAKKVNKNLKILSSSDYRERKKNRTISPRLPYKPNIIYKSEGWISWGDYLGTGRVADQKKKFISYNDAKKYLSKYKFQSVQDFTRLKKNKKFPDNFPKQPPHVYGKQKNWKRWIDFLSLDTVKYLGRYEVKLTYIQAKKVVKNYKLENQYQWNKYIANNKIPINIPRQPRIHYHKKGSWKGWRDFLGLQEYYSFENAKKIIKKLKILSAKEYFIKYNNKIVPSIIPYSPNHYYKNKWISWPDFLGSNLQNEKRRNYLNFFDAKKFVKKLNLKSLSEWQMYSKTKRPLNIPGHPDNIYKKQWKGWYDFLGKKK